MDISEIKDLIDCKNFEGCLKYKIDSNATIYWVIIKTIEGYVIEMFDDSMYISFEDSY